MNFSKLSPKQWLGIILIAAVIVTNVLLWGIRRQATGSIKNLQYSKSSDTAVTVTEKPQLLISNIKNVTLTKKGVCTFDEDSKVACFSSDATQRVILPATLGQAVFSPTGLHVAVQYDDGNKVAWKIYDLINSSLVGSLDPRALNVSFSPDGKRLMYRFKGNGIHNLSTAALDGTDWKAVIDLPASAHNVWWLPEPTLGLFFDLTATESVYRFIRLSSRSQVTLSHGDGLVKLSLNSAHLLLGDGYDPKAPRLLIGTSTIESISLTDVPEIGTTAFSAWDRDQAIVYGITPPGNPTKLYSLEVDSMKEHILKEGDITSWLLQSTGSTPEKPIALTELIGVIHGQLYFVAGGALYSVTLPKQL